MKLLIKRILVPRPIPESLGWVNQATESGAGIASWAAVANAQLMLEPNFEPGASPAGGAREYSR